jgi:hypothetical protein
VTSAVIYVPQVGHMFMYADQCYRYAAAKGYHVVNFVPGNWRQAAALVVPGAAASVLLVARHEHLDPQREPRLEIAVPDDQPHHPRTRPIRRGGTG